MATSDKDITETIRSRPEDGFRLLLGKYKEPVYWHIRRLVVSHADAQDATQEAFIRMYRSFGSLKQGRSLSAWIYRVATNEALRMIERNKSRCISLDAAPSTAAGAAAPQYVDYSDLEAVRLQNAILALPEKQRITFSLRYYDELSYDDIAEITRSTAATAKANYSVAKSKIVEYMNTHY